MAIWREAELETFYADTTPSDRTPCEVRIDGPDIVVSFEGDTGTVTFKGHGENGHFRLELPSVNGRAELHMFPDSNELVGSWIRLGDQMGVCRIDLGDEE